MIRAIIFDFDGVILESVGVKAEGFAALYKQFGYEIVESILQHHHYNVGVSRYEKIRYYHREFLGVEITHAELDKLADRFSKIVVDKVINAPFVKGAEEFLMHSYKNYDFFISTGTQQNEIEIITQTKNISDMFVGIHGSPENKSTHINRIIENFSYSNDEMVFVGDSIQDKIVAEEHKIKFIARILNDNSLLKTEKYCVNDLTQLDDVLAQIEY